MSQNNDPILFVHGFLGWGIEEEGFGRYWEGAHEARQRVGARLTREAGRGAAGRTVDFASVGPISSNWDRARELFYRIKGGEVDYGEHPEDYYGEKEPHTRRLRGWAHRRPLYKDWSAQKPIHLVGHSQGAPTIRVLQYMLEQDAFGLGTDASWIRSVTTISGANNGTTLFYAHDLARDDGRLRPAARLLLLDLALGIAFNLWRDPGLTFELAIRAGSVGAGYGWDLEQWGLKRQHFFKIFGLPIFVEDPLSWLYRILRHDFLLGKDCGPYDVSVHAMAAWNKILTESPETYYFAYVTKAAVQRMNPLLIPFANHMSRFQGLNLEVPGFGDAGDWQPNDGVVPAISQEEPWLGRPGVAGADDEAARKTFRQLHEGRVWPDEPTPKIWHVMRDHLDDWDHLDIVAFPDSEGRLEKQIGFYETLMENLWNLPART